MKFVIRAKSAESSPIRIEGTWTVEAVNPHDAVMLMEEQIALLAASATWTIRPWTPADGDASDNHEASTLPQIAKPTAAA